MRTSTSGRRAIPCAADESVNDVIERRHLAIVVSTMLSSPSLRERLPTREDLVVGHVR